jgi:hypothetical protein
VAAEAAGRLTVILRDLHNNLRKRAGRRPFEYPVEACATSGGATAESASAAGAAAEFGAESGNSDGE